MLISDLTFDDDIIICFVCALINIEILIQFCYSCNIIARDLFQSDSVTIVCVL